MQQQHIPEGETVLFRGDQRTGKTLAMVIMAYIDHLKGRPIFSNLELEFPFTPINFYEIDLTQETIGETPFNQCTLCLDEIWMLFDSRSGNSKDSKRFSRFVYQTKKKGIRLYGTVHDLQHLDLRLRHNYDWLVDCQVYPQKRPDGEPPTHLAMCVQGGTLQPRERPRVKIIKVARLLGMYDTTNTFDPLEKPDWVVDREEKEKLLAQERTKQARKQARKDLQAAKPPEPDFTL